MLKKHWFHFEIHEFINFSLPWDQSTPIGYSGDVLFCIASGECYLIINGALIILFVSIWCCHEAFFKRFHLSVLRLNHPENKPNTNKMLRELIHSHITVKEYVHCPLLPHFYVILSFEVRIVSCIFEFSSRLEQLVSRISPFVLIQLVCNVVFLACSLFKFHFVSIAKLIHKLLFISINDEYNFHSQRIEFELTHLLFVVTTGIYNLFVYCYFGMLATESFQNMAEC